jgi:hypothetical protein
MILHHDACNNDLPEKLIFKEWIDILLQTLILQYVFLEEPLTKEK